MADEESAEGKDRADGRAADVVLEINRATVVMHTVRTAVHELNNALMMISGSAEMLGAMADLPPKARTRVESIQRQVERSHAVVQRVGALARRERAGDQPVDVGKTIERVLELRRYEHTRASIAVTVEGAGSWLRRDEAQDLQVLLLNLVINAEQAVAGRPAPAIHISLAAVDAGVEVAVSDNGPGLPADARDVFEAYVTGKAQSVGVGLTASKALAERRGGSLRAENSATGGGRFVLWLPATPAS